MGSEVDDWKLVGDIGLRLVAVSDEDATPVSSINLMLDAVRTVLEQHGFKLTQWGSWPNMRLAAVEEQRLMDEIFKVKEANMTERADDHIIAQLEADGWTDLHWEPEVLWHGTLNGIPQLVPFPAWLNAMRKAAEAQAATPPTLGVSVSDGLAVGEAIG